MNYLGIDFGDSKIGLALGSTTTHVAVPLEILYYKNFTEVLKKIKEIIDSEQIDKIVLGQPKKMSGADLPNNNLKKFSDALQVLNKEIIFEDERFSTSLTLSVKKTFNFKAGDDDARAAAVILQSYLDRFANGQNL